MSFVPMAKFQFLAQFPPSRLPTQSFLVLYSFCANLQHLFIIIIIIIIIIMQALFQNNCM